MFKRDKAGATAAPEQPVKEGGKGRPTPTRKEAEAAARARAKQSGDKRALARRDREVRSERSKTIRQGMKQGEERYLTPRDRGPVRRFIRDFIDVRFSIVELVIPVMILGLILGYSGNTALARASSLLLMTTLVFVIGDMLIVRTRLRRELRRRFPEESLRGTTYYALTRAMQMKFMRLPKARVKVGQELPEDYAR